MSGSILRWSSEQVDRERAAARDLLPMPEVDVRVLVCPQRTPEEHELGEFPMSCHACHVYADA